MNCMVQRYIKLSEGVDILSALDSEEISLYESHCECDECTGYVPSELFADPDFAEMA